ncbi:hypothetical protein H072_10621 [Dactylellina haptotyla CBS 200.50]|uniref:Mid2 domain-containing protein n=1 Tax=Dactylellina haptotyla (strain CBS 200.50) TaxID=1284197 RepID=S7ZYY9_DACHA|nr:hypothetical protein H072_10621 [Dactylellina haptotyla CBS 200.50]
MQLILELRALVFLVLSALVPLAFAQFTSGTFVVPAGVINEDDTGVDRFDSSIRWKIGSEVDIEWQSSFETVTLKIWQGVWKGSYWSNILIEGERDPGNFTWTVAPVLDEAQDLNIHFQLLNGADDTQFFNSKDFQISNETDVVTQTVGGTTQARTVTREVTVTPGTDTSTNPTSSPATTETTSEPSSSITSSSIVSTTTTNRSSDAAVTQDATTSMNTEPTNTGTAAPKSSGNNTTMKVGLGVGLGLGLPLLACLGFGLFWLGRRRKGAPMKVSSEIPPAPPPPMTFKPAWYDPGGTVGGIESADNHAGGAMYPDR